ncbi:ABC transporter ATP-binding protein [Bifidobacterium cuniculi]|uniref:Putative permease protein of ABC transporter system n=1 Tax=Bifidobacterium cuniculi TaxID=1688 RepID=A0A087ATB4_9BIFI|nr:ABC transporter ATP-binding protein [Bifidobacterium cuniculi]KFI62014.1 putative permease protein of ABC transporter system [Bifidobacterium cuniculi]
MFRIMKYLSKAEMGQLFLALVTIVGQVYFDLQLPTYMSQITTLVETPGSKMADIWAEGGKMLLVSLGSLVCAVVTGYLAARVAASFGQRLRSLEFRKVESFGPSEINRFSTASLITRSTNDVTQIQMFVTMGLQMLVKAPIMAVWAVCKIAGGGFEWTLATGIATAVLLIAVAILMVVVMPKFKAMQQLTDNINLVARENLTGLRVVRAYNADDYQEAKFDRANAELTGTQLFTNRAMSIMMPLMSTVMNGLSLAIYWIGAYLIEAAGVADKLPLFSDMIVFSSYAVQVLMSFLLMSMVFVLWPRADVSAQRVLEVINTQPLIESGSRGRGLTVAEARTAGIVTDADAHDYADDLELAGRIDFRDVSFTYPDSREAMLEHVSFTAEQGQTVAIIGSTGSGKSSLINLVPRFYDVTEGQVLVDGVDVRDYDVRVLRDKIGYVPQQSFLFKGTVASNVSYGDRPGEDGDVPMADTSTAAGRRMEEQLIAAESDRPLTAQEMNRVEEACDVAQATEFVEKMKGGFEASIAQGGTNVSGGQKQRLSIARAVYRKPEILIFDDSFSALDFKTDRVVRDALKDYAKDSTKIIVAQRVGTIMDADRILVVDDGRIVGQGTHRELLETCDVYREIAQSQLSEQELEA